MTTETTTATETQQSSKSSRPTHVAQLRHGQGKNATYEQIGVAWKTENGMLHVKLAGTQLVSQFTLYELPADQKAED